jgi:hypothetical protein
MIDTAQYRRAWDRLTEAVRLHQSLMADPHPGLATWQEFHARSAAEVDRACQVWLAVRTDPEAPR